MLTSPKPSREPRKNEKSASAISSIEVVTRNRGEGEIEHVAKVRFWDKPSAIALLFKVRGHGHLNDNNLNLKGELTVTEQHRAELEAKFYALPLATLKRLQAVMTKNAAAVAAVLGETPTE
jgi:hypothetical protein